MNFATRFTRQLSRPLHRVVSLSTTNASRIKLKPAVPLMAGRAFSNAPPNFGENPTSLTIEQALGILDTTLMYMELGIPGQELDKVASSNGSIGSRWTRALDILANTQLHVVHLFGFTPDQIGLQHYFQANFNATMSGSSEQKSELAKVKKDTWQVMMKRAFDVTDIEPLALEECRYLSSKIGAGLQNPTFLENVSTVYESEIKNSSLAPAQAMEKLHALMMPVYLEALGISEEGTADGDRKYLQMMMSIHDNLVDTIIAQNMSAGIMAVHSKAPIQVAAQ